MYIYIYIYISLVAFRESWFSNILMYMYMCVLYIIGLWMSTRCYWCWQRCSSTWAYLILQIVKRKPHCFSPSSPCTDESRWDRQRQPLILPPPCAGVWCYIHWGCALCMYIELVKLEHVSWVQEFIFSGKNLTCGLCCVVLLYLFKYLMCVLFTTHGFRYWYIFLALLHVY